MLLQRLSYGAAAMTAREALYLATMGGATVLHRQDEIGSLEKGKAADLIAFDLSGIEFAGALSDPLAAIVHCAAGRVDLAMVNGNILVQQGRLVDESVLALIPQQNLLAQQFAE